MVGRSPARRWSRRARSRSAVSGLHATDIARNQFTYDAGQGWIAVSVRGACSPCQSTHRRHAGRTPGSDRATDPHAGLRSSGPEPGSDRGQPLPSHHPARTRIWRSADARSGGAARRAGSAQRAALHLPECQYRAPVRVHPERVADERQVRRHERRGRSAARQPRAELPPGHPTDGFTLQQPNGISRRIGGMPTFVTVRGGAYFFLPGLRALRYFAGG